jgi:hypothetical protein
MYMLSKPDQNFAGLKGDLINLFAKKGENLIFD